MYVIWFNPHHLTYYLTYYKSYKDYSVGFKNSYSHEVVQVLFYNYKKNKLVACLDRYDYYLQMHQKKTTIKSRIKSMLIDFINKL